MNLDRVSPARTLRRRWLAGAAVLAAGIGAAGAELPGRGLAATPGIVCPARAPDTLAASSWPPARTVLAPPGAIRIALCRYGGMNDHPPLRLQGDALITGRRAAKLTREFDSLPGPPNGITACPADDGSRLVATLRYRTHHVVVVGVELTGCLLVGNGHVVRLATGALLAQLGMLTRVIHTKPTLR